MPGLTFEERKHILEELDEVCQEHNLTSKEFLDLAGRQFMTLEVREKVAS
jgi:hypothetical protein